MKKSIFEMLTGQEGFYIGGPVGFIPYSPPLSPEEIQAKEIQKKKARKEKVKISLVVGAVMSACLVGSAMISSHLDNILDTPEKQKDWKVLSMNKLERQSLENSAGYALKNASLYLDNQYKSKAVYFYNRARDLCPTNSDIGLRKWKEYDSISSGLLRDIKK